MHRAKLSHPTRHIILDVRPITQISICLVGTHYPALLPPPPPQITRALNLPPISLLFISSL